MRILFLTSRLPHPPDRGDRLRTQQFLRLFAGEHAVTLVSFVADERERALAEQLEPYCEQIQLVKLPSWRSAAYAVFNVWRDLPLQVLYYRSGRMRGVVDSLISTGSYDMAYVHLFRMAPYLEDYSQLYRVLDLTDLVSYELQSSLPYQHFPWKTIYGFEEPRVARYERRMASRFDEVWFISGRDRELFSEDGGRANIQVIPNSMDETLFLVEQSPSGASKLLFVGHLDVKHNIDALTYLAREIMPLVLQQAPDCQLQIVGAGNVQNVKEVEALPGIEVLGYVPDLSTVFADSAIAVAPLRFSAGMQNKVVESMAAGLPVVTTGSVSEGLGSEPGQHLLVADSAPDFARQVVHLLQDERLRKQFGRAGREFVRERLTTQPAVDRLQAIHDLVS